MYPTLIRFGPVAIRTYGVFLAMAFILGLLLLKRKTRRLGISSEEIDKLFVWVLVSAIVGSRIFYVLSEWNIYKEHLLDIFRVWEGGLHFFGGFIGAFFSVVFFSLRHPSFPLWKFADAVSPSLSLGLVLGKTGCFFAGCCYGRECSLPWAVTFNHTESLAIRGVGLHPVQIYEAAVYLLIFFIAQTLYGIKTRDGKLFWFIIFLISFARFNLDFFRWEQKIFIGLTLYQIVSFLFAILSLIFLIFLSFTGNEKKRVEG